MLRCVLHQDDTTSTEDHPSTTLRPHFTDFGNTKNDPRGIDSHSTRSSPSRQSQKFKSFKTSYNSSILQLGLSVFASKIFFLLPSLLSSFSSSSSSHPSFFSSVVKPLTLIVSLTPVSKTSGIRTNHRVKVMKNLFDQLETFGQSERLFPRVFIIHGVFSNP